MTTEVMNIHRALTELKTIDARIAKEISGGTYVYAIKQSASKHNGESIESVNDSIFANFQRTTDLIRRRNAIKQAVVLSNAQTKVFVAGTEYTVAEAIEMKNHGLDGKRLLLGAMSRAYQNAQYQCERANGDIQDRADAHIRNLYSAADLKNMSEEMKRVREEFVNSQTMVVVDPLAIRTEIERLTTEIDQFMVEVDAALSVSNALTEITVEY